MSVDRAQLSLNLQLASASTYSYVAALRIEGLSRAAGVALTWKPFLLGPIFQLLGWNDSPFNINELRGAYMWRDLERLTAKFGLPGRSRAASRALRRSLHELPVQTHPSDGSAISSRLRWTASTGQARV